MGTIRSACPYDAVARHALQSANLRLPAILYYASRGRNLPTSIASGYPLLADVPIHPGIDAMGHEQTSTAMQQKPCLLDHLVGDGEHVLRDFEAHRLCGLQVDHQLELGRSLHWQIGRLLTFENSIDVGGRSPEQIGVV